MTTETVTRIQSSKAQAFYTEYVKRFAQDPMRFCRQALKMEPTWQQTQMLEAIVGSTRLAARSGHGCGKSSVCAAIILWFLTTRPYARVLATGPNISILNKVLWPELAGRFYSLAQTYPPIGEMFGMTRTSIFHKDHPTRWFGISRTARKENSQGLAGQHAHFLLCIVEEASAVDDSIFEVLDGALTSGDQNKLIMVGNPTATYGRFYEAFHSKQDHYTLIHWDGEESPLVSQDMIDLFKEEYHEGSREYLVRVKGEFPPQTSGMLLSRNEISKIDQNDFEHSATPMRVISVDVAGSGRDSSVILIADVSGDGSERNTEIIDIREYEIGVDTVQLAGEIAFLSKERPCRIIVDSIGVGQGVSDLLSNNEVAHISLNWGQPSWFKDRFVNQRAEAYHWLREGLNREAVKGPRHLRLYDQLSNLPYTYNDRGKLQMMSKDRMRAKNIKSPDLADALAQTYLVTHEAIGTSHSTQDEEESVLFGAAEANSINQSVTSRVDNKTDAFSDFLKTDW